MAISLGLDAIYKLVLDGRLKKKYRLIAFLDELSKGSEALLDRWIQIEFAIKKLPRDRWSAACSEKYFDSLAECSIPQVIASHFLGNYIPNYPNSK